MKFFKKRSTAIVITALLIAASLVIGFAGKPSSSTAYQPESASAAEKWAADNYDAYLPYVQDTGELLSEEAEKQLAIRNAELVYQYNSLIAVVTEKNITDLEDFAYDTADEMDLAAADGILVIDAVDHAWYAAFGDELVEYVNHDLELLFQEKLGAALTVGEEEKQLSSLYDELPQWYGNNIPVSTQQAQPVQQIESAPSGTSRIGIGRIILIVVLIWLAIRLFSGGYRPGYRSEESARNTTQNTTRRTSSFWPFLGGFWLGSRSGRNRNSDRNPPPPPHSSANRNPYSSTGRSSFGSSHNSSHSSGFGHSSSRSSFGGGSRGGGFHSGGTRSGGSRGGFGGGSRGGGFGGRH